ncbi:hypothetical protein HDU79_009580 [Rhizoclosmatium sp. JEL0117]|nr:hypothetical protein HDU79_009580 [Rhizoclosmatium sp. JEL0117]
MISFPSLQLDYGLPQLKAEPLEFDEYLNDAAMCLADEIESNCGSDASIISRSSSILTDGPEFDGLMEATFNAIDIRSIMPEFMDNNFMKMNADALQRDIDQEMMKLEVEELCLSLEGKPATVSNHSESELYSCDKPDLFMGMVLAWTRAKDSLLKDQLQVGCHRLADDGRLNQYNIILSKTQEKIQEKVHAFKINSHEKNNAHLQVINAVNASVGALIAINFGKETAQH